MGPKKSPMRVRLAAAKTACFPRAGRLVYKAHFSIPTSAGFLCPIAPLLTSLTNHQEGIRDREPCANWYTTEQISYSFPKTSVCRHPATASRTARVCRSASLQIRQLVAFLYLKKRKALTSKLFSPSKGLRQVVLRKASPSRRRVSF